MAGFSLCLIKVLQCFEYASGSKYARARCMTGCLTCLNKPEFALIIPNLLEYACKYLNKQSSQYDNSECL